MRFALVNNERSEAEPGLHGICPGCMQPVIAKCGTQKIRHWAHKSKKSCDSWWESETEWHRSWKNNFPNDWQEVFFTDKATEEKHIADVCTEHGLVIEFQHSSIKPEERISRENFYKNMVWVVDGTRLKYDYKRFLKGKDDFGLGRIIKQGFFSCSYPDELFPKNWLQSSVPVIFDFLGLEEANDLNDLRKPLYCLFPQRIGSEALLVVASRESFINTAVDGKLFDFIKEQTNSLNQEQTERLKIIEHQKRIEQAHINALFLQRSRYPRRRFRL